MFLVVMDAHSKWLEVHPMPMITTQATIKRLSTILPSLVYHKDLCQMMDQPLSAENLSISCVRMGLSM